MPEISPVVNPEWRDSLIERAERTYERDKNHCSVIILSCGTESGYSNNNAEMLDWFHEHDKMRLTHCEDASRTPFLRYKLEIEVYSNGEIKTKLIGDVKEECVWLPRLGFEYHLTEQNIPFKCFGLYIGNAI